MRLISGGFFGRPRNISPGFASRIRWDRSRGYDLSPGTGKTIVCQHRLGVSLAPPSSPTLSDATRQVTQRGIVSRGSWFWTVILSCDKVRVWRKSDLQLVWMIEVDSEFPSRLLCCVYKGPRAGYGASSVFGCKRSKRWKPVSTYLPYTYSVVSKVPGSRMKYVRAQRKKKWGCWIEITSKLRVYFTRLF